MSLAGICFVYCLRGVQVLLGDRDIAGGRFHFAGADVAEGVRITALLGHFQDQAQKYDAGQIDGDEGDGGGGQDRGARDEHPGEHCDQKAPQVCGDVCEDGPCQQL